VKLGAKRIKAAQLPYFERDHAWFAAFAPADDPEIVVVVLNEHSGFGSSNAAPTAMAVMKKYMELKALDEAARAGPLPPPAPPGYVSPAPAPPAPPPVTPARAAEGKNLGAAGGGANGGA
jgi:penicillin-binding protein 2